MQILATFDANGSPVELQPGAPFKTFKQVVQDAEEIEAINARDPDGPQLEPGDLWAFEADHSAVALASYTQADFERFRIQTVTVAEPPAGKHRTGYSLSVASGVIVASATFANNPAPAVPAKVSALQLTLALDELGLLDGVEAAVAASPRAVQLYWAKTDPFERAHPMIDQLAAGIGKTSGDVDNVFRLAATKS